MSAVSQWVSSNALSAGCAARLCVALLLSWGLPGQTRSDEPQAPAPLDFSQVKDFTPVDQDVPDAYYALLDRAGSQSVEELTAEARRFVRQQHQQGPFSNVPLDKYPLFYEMLTRPRSFRGEPVFVRGHVLRTDRYEAGPNPFGITQLYETWLVSDDAQNHPLTIVFLEQPEGLQEGEELVDGVEVAGYFYKVFTYPSVDQRVRKAPLILARTVTIRPPSPTASATPAAIVAIGLLVGLALVSGVVIGLQFQYRRRLRRLRSSQLPDQLPNLPT